MRVVARSFASAKTLEMKNPQHHHPPQSLTTAIQLDDLISFLYTVPGMCEARLRVGAGINTSSFKKAAHAFSLHSHTYIPGTHTYHIARSYTYMVGRLYSVVQSSFVQQSVHILRMYVYMYVHRCFLPWIKPLRFIHTSYKSQPFSPRTATTSKIPIHTKYPGSGLVRPSPACSSNAGMPTLLNESPNGGER